jgi:hypothetical protein
MFLGVHFCKHIEILFLGVNFCKHIEILFLFVNFCEHVWNFVPRYGFLQAGGNSMIVSCNASVVNFTTPRLDWGVLKSKIFSSTSKNALA